jgi:hypothetical protein
VGLHRPADDPAAEEDPARRQMQRTLAGGRIYLMSAGPDQVGRRGGSLDRRGPGTARRPPQHRPALAAPSLMGLTGRPAPPGAHPLLPDPDALALHRVLLVREMDPVDEEKQLDARPLLIIFENGR